MAVNINIPGIGNVSASDAATESTLRALLAATQGANTIIRSNESTIAYQQALQERSAQATNAHMTSIGSNTRRAGTDISRFADDVSSGLAGVNQRAYTLGQYLVDLRHAAAALTDRFVSNYESLATDPVGSSVKTVNTLIDLFTGALSGLLGTFTSFGSKLLSVEKNFSIAKFLSGAGERIGEAAKYVNEFLGKQLQITLDSFREFNRMGTTFADGMSTIRAATGSAGILLQQFTLGIRSSIDSVRNLGIGTESATVSVARVMEQLAKSTHDVVVRQLDDQGNLVAVTRTQSTYRESLRRLGYEIEDQIALSADFLAVQRASMTSEQFREYTRRGIDQTVAKDTLDYAKNLRLIANLTGANASELAKEARDKQLSAVALANLNAEQRKTFGQVSTALIQFPVVQKAIDQLIATQGGNFLDPALQNIAASIPEFDRIIRGIYSNIVDGVMTPMEAAEATATDVAAVSRLLEENHNVLRPMINAATLGAGGTILRDIVDIVNGFNTLTIDPQAVEATRIAIEVAASAPDKLTQSLNKSAETMLEIGAKIKRLTTGNVLTTYSSFLERVNNGVRVFVEGIANLPTATLNALLSGKDIVDTFIDSLPGGSDIGVNMGQEIPDNLLKKKGVDDEAMLVSEIRPENFAVAGLNGGDVLTAMKQVKGSTDNVVAAQVNADSNSVNANKALLDKLDTQVAKLGELLDETRLQNSYLQKSARASQTVADSTYRLNAAVG